MEFVIKRNNKVEYQTRTKLLKGKFIVKNISIVLTSDDPSDLSILMMHQKKIEKEIVADLNKNFKINV